MILNERILNVVLALVEEMHFGRAAARLHISQPALSGTLKVLEQSLGVSLFKRTSRRVEITEAGQVFAEEARRLIQEMQRAVTLVRESSPDILGPLRLGYTALTDLRWLCNLVANAQEDPDLGAKLHFVSYEAASLFDELIKGTLHAALVFGCLRHPDLHCETLFREPLCAVVSGRHPLAQKGAVDLRELCDEPVVWLRHDRHPAHRDTFQEVLRGHGCNAHITQEVTTFFECIEFAGAGLGVTFAPAFLQQETRADVTFLRLHEQELKAEYSLAYRHNRRPPNLDHLLRFITEHARARNRDSRDVHMGATDPAEASLQ